MAMTSIEIVQSLRQEADQNYELYRSTLNQLRSAMEELNTLRKYLGDEKFLAVPPRVFHTKSHP